MRFVSIDVLPNHMIRTLYAYLLYLEEHYTWPNYSGEF